MLRAGLTGGYASGKSLVAKHLESLECRVVYADLLGHQVLSPSGEAYRSAVALFGREILSMNDEIDRKKLAAIVFSNPERLQKLNDIVHPAVFRLEEQMLAAFEAQDKSGIAVIEAAILIETGRSRTLDKLIVTSCSRETQVLRGMARDRISREAALARIDRQLSDAERVRAADYVIDTNGSAAETIVQTERIHAELRQLAEAFRR